MVPPAHTGPRDRSAGRAPRAPRRAAALRSRERRPAAGSTSRRRPHHERRVRVRAQDPPRRRPLDSQHRSRPQISSRPQMCDHTTAHHAVITHLAIGRVTARRRSRPATRSPGRRSLGAGMYTQRSPSTYEVEGLVTDRRRAPGRPEDQHDPRVSARPLRPPGGPGSSDATAPRKRGSSTSAVREQMVSRPVLTLPAVTPAAGEVSLAEMDRRSPIEPPPDSVRVPGLPWFHVPPWRA